MSVEHDEGWLRENIYGVTESNCLENIQHARKYREHMKAKEADQLANEIADRLFSNGINQKAKRLVLELENDRDGGGWCKGAVIDQIKRVLLGDV